MPPPQSGFVQGGGGAERAATLWPLLPVQMPASQSYDFENTFLLWYVRGPEGLTVELADGLGGAPG